MPKLTGDTARRMATELAGIGVIDQKHADWLASQVQKTLEAVDKAARALEPEIQEAEPATVFKVRTKDGQ